MPVYRLAVAKKSAKKSEKFLLIFPLEPCK